MSLPVVGTPFTRVGMDLIGPLEKSTAQHQVCLGDHGLCHAAIQVAVIAAELTKVFAQVGVPKETITGPGTNIMLQ